MRIAVCIAMAFVLLSSAAQPQPQTEQRTVTIADLKSRPIIGELGIPLGTTAELAGEIVSGRELREKALDSLYLLRITHVNGKALRDSPTLSFSVAAIARAELAADAFSLYELKTGKRTTQLNDAQIRQLERGYVGRRVRVAAYETGKFVGIPGNLPRDIPVWADRAFHFANSLMVVAERAAGKQ